MHKDYVQNGSLGTKPVLVIGSSGLDLVGRSQCAPQPGASNPGHIRTSGGGVARNIAETLARLGQPVNLITAVGEDRIGRQLLQHTEAAGVDVSASIFSADNLTGTYMAMLGLDGRLLYAMDDMRVISALTSDHLLQYTELFNQASLVFVDANLAPKTLRTVLSLARKAKLPICADATSVSLVERLRPYLNRIHLLTLNSYEASVLTNSPLLKSDREAALVFARQLVSIGVDIVLVTMAEFGVCYATSETSGHISAIRTPIYDPTGAGDAMTATVIFALLNDIPLDEAVYLGVSAASLTLRYPGTVLPDLTLEKLYDHLSI